MNELKLRMALYRMKRKMYVNNQLKEDLRNNFAPGKKRIHNYTRRWTAIAAAICIILISSLAILVADPSPVSAESLKIENYLSFASLGGGRNLLVSEYKGIVYVNLLGEGLFVYSDKRFSEIYRGQVNSVSVSRDGKKLVFSEGGSIKIYDVTTGSINVVLEGSGSTNYYEASWLPDNHSIIYTRETAKPVSGKEEQLVESSIFIMDLNHPEPKKVAEGSYASYVNGKDAIVYENRREGKVIYKSLKDNSEIIIGYGAEPNASPDGRYIAMTKSEISTKEVKKNVKIETGLQNIYILDTDNLNVMKKVTGNIPLKDIDEEEWLKNIKPSEEEQILSYNGMYCYRYPTWSCDSKSIFAMKRISAGNDPRRDEVRLIKISFTEKELSGQKSVERYLQAVTTTDYDYANSLTGFVDTGAASKDFSMIGYNLVTSGSEEKMEYVDAVSHFINNGSSMYNSIYMIEKSRYYLDRKDGNPIIKDRQLLSTVEISNSTDTISMTTDGNRKSTLLSLTDIPKEYLGGKTDKFASIAFSPVNNTVYFTLQSAEKKDSLKVLCYIIPSKELKLLDSIAYEDAEVSPRKLIVDYSGQYAALDYQLKKGDAVKSISMVYSYKDQGKRNLNSIAGQDQADSLTIAFAENGNFVFKNLSFGQYMWFKYLPSKSEVQAVK